MYTHSIKSIELKEIDDNNTRKEDIINFLKFHQGCSKEDVVRGVAKQMSKKTVYKMLDELIQYNIVIQERDKPNSKNYRLFLNSKNYSLIVTEELNEFEKCYFQLLSKIVKSDRLEKFKKLKEVSLDYFELITVDLYAYTSIILSLKIIDFVLHTYMSKLFFIWPYIISDKKLLRQINLDIFSRIFDIFNRSLNILPIKKFPNKLELSKTFLEKNIVFDKYTLVSINQVIANIEFYRLFNSDKEYEHLLDILWEIYKELVKVVYNDNPIVIVNSLSKERLLKYKPQIDINKDNWRKIISEKMIDSKHQFYSTLKIQYIDIKKDAGLRFNERFDLAERMIQELKKLNYI